MMRAADGAPFGPYNIGTGVETTVNALADTLELPTRREPPRPGEVLRSCLDPLRAADELGWKARTDLRAGLDRTLEWARTAAGSGQA
jgi:UDP-glucose 4-epimerase